MVRTAMGRTVESNPLASPLPLSCSAVKPGGKEGGISGVIPQRPPHVCVDPADLPLGVDDAGGLGGGRRAGPVDRAGPPAGAEQDGADEGMELVDDAAGERASG